MLSYHGSSPRNVGASRADTSQGHAAEAAIPDLLDDFEPVLKRDRAHGRRIAAVLMLLLLLWVASDGHGERIPARGTVGTTWGRCAKLCVCTREGDLCRVSDCSFGFESDIESSPKMDWYITSQPYFRQTAIE